MPYKAVKRAGKNSQGKATKYAIVKEGGKVVGRTNDPKGALAARYAAHNKKKGRK